MSLWTFSARTRLAARYGTARSSAPMGAAFSPDGAWVAYAVANGSAMTLYVEPFPATAVRYPLTARASDTPKHPRWFRGSSELFYNPNAGSFEIVSVTRSPFAFGNAMRVSKRIAGGPPGSRTPYDLTRDGRVIGVITAGRTEYVRGAENQLEVILNWFTSLQAKAPRR